MSKARVIITTHCRRSCSYCCNRYPHILNSAVNINNLGEIPHRDEINITGGEPMEVPLLAEKMVHEARVFGFQTVYLYTARYDSTLKRLLPVLDGLHYTLHQGMTKDDVLGFLKIQGLIQQSHFDKSYRLAISPDIEQHIPIVPSVWSEVRIKHWRNEEEAIVPVDEVLYRLVY